MSKPDTRPTRSATARLAAWPRSLAVILLVIAPAIAGSAQDDEAERDREVSVFWETSHHGHATTAHGLTAPGHQHKSRWVMSERFIREEWRYPLATMDVTMGCAGPVHKPVKDCEIHIAAELAGQLAGISDFSAIVLEPPSVCKDTTRTYDQWRAFYNAVDGSDCRASGFVRVWPEHLSESNICSNPAHFMELHPLLGLDCGAALRIDFRDKLRSFPDLGYNQADRVEGIIRNFRVWVKKSDHPDLGSVVEFDYGVCREDGICTRPAIPNFLRLLFKPLVSTIRHVERGSEPFVTSIVKAKAVSPEDDPTWGGRTMFVKVYAIPRTDIHDALVATEGDDTPPAMSAVGIFTVDPLSVIKALDDPASSADWVEVPYPVAVILFGKH